MRLVHTERAAEHVLNLYSSPLQMANPGENEHILIREVFCLGLKWGATDSENLKYEVFCSAGQTVPRSRLNPPGQSL